MMASSSSSVADGVFFFLVLSSVTFAPSSATSEDQRPLDPSMPQAEVTFTNPKSSLIQLAWTFRVPEDQRRVTDMEVFARDPELKSFTCENDNYNDGICTISGLSAEVTYNVTVRACGYNGCGYPSVVYITTVSEPRIYFGAIFVIFISIVILTFAVLNYDLFVEILQPCWKKIKQRRSGSRYRVEPSEPDAHPDRQESSITKTSDVPLTLMNRSQTDENYDMDDISSAIRESPEDPENDYRKNEMDEPLSDAVPSTSTTGHDASLDFLNRPHLDAAPGPSTTGHDASLGPLDRPLFDVAPGSSTMGYGASLGP